MENKEIKRTLPVTHDCNLCEKCQESIRDGWNKCNACKFIFLKKLYKDFSSGNKEVDEIIKNPIYIPPKSNNKFGSGKVNYYEWIPWEGLSNIKEIAKGGFGIIYKATLIDGLIDVESIKHHSSMEYKRGRTNNFEEKIDEVAIKIIPTNSSEVFKELNIQRAMFINNDERLCRISRIYGITQNAETLEYGIVMELAKHGDMRKFLSTNFHFMNWRDKLMIAFRIAEGLESIHFSGMVHRDLHSGNILQLTNKYINIGDLGLCQSINNEATTTTTTERATEKKKIYGVIPYIPPEVLRGENFTLAGDIYSCGMLLWELATGKPPFHDRSHDYLLIMDILNGIRPEITSPFIQPSIAEIIVKCWDVNPENRPTAFELGKKFEEFEVWNSEFVESDKYIREMLKKDSTTNYSTTRIHPGAVYTSRLLTAQMVDFSKELVYLPENNF
ncbi:hypothetical protein G9A89_008320 [Geosiphon pyriformis]|nr:hypothetical protein G9A89_008320 [Geosiphon pyriformis]